MSRFCASPENRRVGVSFANAVTAVVHCEKPSANAIERKGEHSIFAVFTRCFRRCVRDNSRRGLSPAEMNKDLEASGFKLVRFRGDMGRQNPNGCFKFGSRRWRNPDNPDDLEFLHAVWPQINQQAPVACPFPVLLQSLREAIAGPSVDSGSQIAVSPADGFISRPLFSNHHQSISLPQHANSQDALSQAATPKASSGMLNGEDSMLAMSASPIVKHETNEMEWPTTHGSVLYAAMIDQPLQDAQAEATAVDTVQIAAMVADEWQSAEPFELMLQEEEVGGVLSPDGLMAMFASGD